MIKVGLIDYLNAYPFVWGLEHDTELEGLCEFHKARPGDLNRLLQAGELDAAMVSSFAYAEQAEQFLVAPVMALSSQGYVDSVRLVSHFPLSELSGKKLFLTTASATSNNALKIILHDQGVEGVDYDFYAYQEGIPDLADAAVIIGDEALQVSAESFAYSYDIGELWSELYQRNIVFALFVLNKESYYEQQESFKLLLEELDKAAELSFSQELFMQDLQKNFPFIAEPMAYLKRLQFDFSESSAADLQFYLDKAYECELLPQAVNIEILRSEMVKS